MSAVRHTVLAETVPVSGHRAVDFALSDTTRALLFDGVAANTRRAHERQWRGFTAWCAAAGHSALPATEVTLAEYVAHVCGRDLASASITQAIATICTARRRAPRVARDSRGQPGAARAPSPPRRGGAALR